MFLAKAAPLLPAAEQDPNSPAGRQLQVRLLNPLQADNSSKTRLSDFCPHARFRPESQKAVL